MRRVGAHDGGCILCDRVACPVRDGNSGPLHAVGNVVLDPRQQAVLPYSARTVSTGWATMKGRLDATRVTTVADLPLVRKLLAVRQHWVSQMTTKLMGSVQPCLSAGPVRRQFLYTMVVRHDVPVPVPYHATTHPLYAVPITFSQNDAP